MSKLTVTTKDNVKIAYKQIGHQHASCLLILHGFYNSKEALLLDQLAHQLKDSYDVISIDFRGHGKSGGLFSWTSKEYLDVAAMVELIKSQYQSIGVIGFSLGAATALISASTMKAIKSIVAVSAPVELEKVEYRLWELDPKIDLRYSLLGEGRIGKGVRPGPWWLPKEKPIHAVTKIHQPLYFIHGTNDWIIKPWHSQKLYEQAISSTKKIDIIKNGPHAEYLMLTHQEFLVVHIKQWFKETLG